MVARANGAAAAARPSRRPGAQKEVLAIVRAMKRVRQHVERRPSGAVARERLYELMCEIGELHNGCEIGWIAHVSRKLNMPYGTAHEIVAAGRRGDLRSIRCETVDKAIAATGIPPEAFYDSEFRG